MDVERNELIDKNFYVGYKSTDADGIVLQNSVDSVSLKSRKKKWES